MSDAAPAGDEAAKDFIRDVIREDLASGQTETVVTRFPPEPNGYLHIGHAKSMCLNFGVAREFGGRCHLRFDDTNPVKEEHEFIEAIQEDVRWLGFDWGEHLYFASGHFETLYEWALHLIRAGKAYVDDLTPDEIREYRGTLTEPGRNSPYRDRPVEENLDLFTAHAGRRVQGRRAGAARQDRHGVGQHQHARPGALPHPPCRASAHRRRHWCIYPTYDFRPWPVGRDRRGDAFPVHARVRGPPAALRLADREPAGAVACRASTSFRAST